MRMGMILSRIRKDEKLLIKEAEKRDITVTPVDNKELVFELEHRHLEMDAALERCVDHHRAVYALTVLESWGIPTVNRQPVVETYGNRLLTALALKDKGVPMPEIRMAFTPDSALEAMEELGYPVVLKPVEGPEGQLISRIQDKYTARTVLEHKRILGAYHHSIFFIQKYIEMPGHDIRVYVVGDKAVAAVSVLTDHWITPIPVGGLLTGYPMSDALGDLAVQAAQAVGGGIMVVDMIRTKDAWFVVEIGPATGLTEASEATGVNIPGHIMEYVLETVHSGEAVI